MHKTEACLQMLGLRGDPRCSLESLLLVFLVDISLLGDEHVLSVSEIAI
jgi:hypothetical protein